MRTVLKKSGKIEEQQAIKWIMQVANAIEYIHSKNYIHRDIKPENILIDEKGNAKLADLGIVSKGNQADTVAGS